jgi:hypothetical protein
VVAGQALNVTNARAAVCPPAAGREPVPSPANARGALQVTSTQAAGTIGALATGLATAQRTSADAKLAFHITLAADAVGFLATGLGACRATTDAKLAFHITLAAGAVGSPATGLGARRATTNTPDAVHVARAGRTIEALATGLSGQAARAGAADAPAVLAAHTAGAIRNLRAHPGGAERAQQGKLGAR